MVRSILYFILINIASIILKISLIPFKGELMPFKKYFVECCQTKKYIVESVYPALVYPAIIVFREEWTFSYAFLIT